MLYLVETGLVRACQGLAGPAGSAQMCGMKEHGRCLIEPSNMGIFSSRSGIYLISISGWIHSGHKLYIR